MYRRDNTKKIYLIISTVVIIIVMMVSAGKTTYLSHAVNYVTTPIYNIFYNVNKFFGDSAKFVGNIGKLNSQNEKLIEENKELKLENSILKRYKEENDELRKLLKLKEDNTYAFITAGEVIAMPVTNWNKTFIINKGENDGVLNGMIAINYDGLVGKIVEVNKTSSKIRPIVDERVSVSSLISRNNEKVIVKGDSLTKNKNVCKLDYITLDADVLEGDNIVTSYISQTYPKGIPVGEVKKVSINKNTSKKEVLVEPAVDFDKLEKVIIIENKKTEDIDDLTEELD